MMNRSSKAITLVLVGTTAALAGFGVLHRATNPGGDDSTQMSDFGAEGEGFVGDATQPSTRRGQPGRHFVGTSPGYSSSRYRNYSYSHYSSTPAGRSSGTINRSSSSGSSSSGSSSSHGSGTSRGGFGSSGHAASSGS